MISRFSSRRCLIGCSLIALIATGNASASDDKADADAQQVADRINRPLEEIIVSGQYRPRDSIDATKTNVPLIDVPQSLSVVSRAQIEDQQFLDIGDVLRFTPGASVGQGEGHRDQITIRGQNTTADFFLDGIRDDVQYFRPFYNIERIEILRGANALIFGRGGGGGVINRVTKTPTIAETFTIGSASIDSFGDLVVSGDTNLTVGDSAAVRLNAYYQSLDNHRDFFGGDRYAVNPTFASQVGDDTWVLLSYEYVDDERTVDRGVPALGDEPLRGFDDTFFGDPDANLTTFNAHILKGRVEHEFSETLSFNTTIQYADYDKLYQNLFPIGFSLSDNEVSLDGYLDTTQRENLIVQSNLVADVTTGPLQHNLLFGVEYGDQDTENARRDVLFDQSNDDEVSFAFSDPLAIPAFSFPEFNRDRASDVEFFSVYLQDQIDIGDHFQVVAGLRYDRFEIDVVDQVALNNGEQGFLGRNDEEVSPRVGLIYKPLQNVSFYTSYSKSFLPRSGDQFLSLTPTSESLAPEKFENYEIGVKYDLDSGLSLTAAVFDLERDGGTTVDPTDPGNTLLIGSRTRGFEVQAVGEVLPQWTINAGYSYLDADERGRVVGDTIANRRLSQVPEQMFSIWNRYQATDRLSIGLGATYQSSQFASISNQVRLPDFFRVDAAATYELTETVKVQLNIENLFDTDYFPAAHNDNNITTGEPINARLTITGRF